MKKFFVFVLLLMAVNVNSQDEEIQESSKFINPVFGTEVRGKNVFTLALGTSVINGDYIDPLFEIYSHYGYKRYFGRYINVGFTYHKFNLAYKDLFNEGFMSFDLNAEITLMPNNVFTPFVFFGGGYNASNYFEETSFKAQAGLGVEYLVLEQLGVKLQADYNHVFTDELDGLVKGEADDVYWRVAFGVNFYFEKWNKKRRIKPNEPTIINSNPIIHN
ncbi:Curli production assembly/transport component CsgG [Pontimicrobium sp. IMCC45349]|uniref:Curli production assembly/transport component CsgG n=1 Tax=Pontimicrobium sp. IMCC45349 TaxID=3391574 RepID=UPI0039A0CD25